jgi:hypothetical protein
MRHPYVPLKLLFVSSFCIATLAGCIADDLEGCVEKVSSLEVTFTGNVTGMELNTIDVFISDSDKDFLAHQQSVSEEKKVVFDSVPSGDYRLLGWVNTTAPKNTINLKLGYVEIDNNAFGERSTVVPNVWYVDDSLHILPGFTEVNSHTVDFSDTPPAKITRIININLDNDRLVAPQGKSAVRGDNLSFRYGIDAQLTLGARSESIPSVLKNVGKGPMPNVHFRIITGDCSKVSFSLENLSSTALQSLSQDSKNKFLVDNELKFYLQRDFFNKLKGTNGSDQQPVNDKVDDITVFIGIDTANNITIDAHFGNWTNVSPIL